MTGQLLDTVSPNIEERQDVIDALAKRFWPAPAFEYTPQPAYTSYSDRANWRASSEFGGSPGTAGIGVQPSGIVFSELLANTDAPATDQIELFNTGGQDVVLTNWYLSDTADDYFRSKIAAPTVVPALGYHVLSELELGFPLNSAHGGQLWLISADADGRPLQFVDHVEYPASGKSRGTGHR